ncbi:hypothetical protein NK662_14280 [Ectobacillus sp. SYSU M60031]|uniref:Uncharacterized protein n=1 Tax=Ectobacillus ponti TaxID=2961894 RepID=A0AA41XA34_9BACI|nr:hypothetical protein [Ectobacillus ponti]
MGYTREEQETTIVFNNATGEWTIYSTVPKHIRKLQEITEILVLEREGDRPIAVRGTLSEKQVSMKREIQRVLTQEQKDAAAARMAEARARKGDG